MMSRFLSVASLIFFLCMLMSCGNPVKDEFIASCRLENDDLKTSVDKMKVLLKQEKELNAEHRMLFVDFTKTRKKKTLAENGLVAKINTGEKELELLIRRHSLTTDSLSAVAKHNDSLINFFMEDRPDVEKGNEEWGKSIAYGNVLKLNADKTMLLIKKQRRHLDDLYVDLLEGTNSKKKRVKN